WRLQSGHQSSCPYCTRNLFMKHECCKMRHECPILRAGNSHPGEKSYARAARSLGHSLVVYPSAYENASSRAPAGTDRLRRRTCQSDGDEVGPRFARGVRIVVRTDRRASRADGYWLSD